MGGVALTAKRVLIINDVVSGDIPLFVRMIHKGRLVVVRVQFYGLKILKFSPIYLLTTYALPPTFTNIILFLIPSHSLPSLFHSTHDPTIRKQDKKQ